MSEEVIEQGSNNSESRKRIVTPLKYALPSRDLSLEAHLDVVKAYVVSSNYGKKAVGYKDLESIINYGATAVSASNKFLQDIHLITFVERGNYLPTQEAIDLYKNIQWKKEDEVKSILQRVLSSSWFYNVARQVIEINGPTSETDLIEKLGIHVGAEPEKHKSSIAKLVQFLKYSDLLIEKEGKLHINLNKSSEVEKQSNPQPQAQTYTQNTIDQKKEIRLSEIIPQSHITININLSITPDMTEEQIRTVLRAVRSELTDH